MNSLYLLCIETLPFNKLSFRILVRAINIGNLFMKAEDSCTPCKYELNI